MASASPPARPGNLSLMTEPLELTIRYEQGEDGWVVASIEEVPGALSQGRTRAEARENVIDALRLMLKPDPESEDAGGESEPLQLKIAS
jgi:predicted RNase H-like HicB family nuclease